MISNKDKDRTGQVKTAATDAPARRCTAGLLPPNAEGSGWAWTTTDRQLTHLPACLPTPAQLSAAAVTLHSVQITRSKVVVGLHGPPCE